MSAAPICTPPQMGGYVFGTTLAGCCAVDHMPWSRAVRVSAAAAVGSFVFIVAVATIGYRASMADYGRCEQRTRITVGAK